MYTVGPAMSFLTSFWLLEQNEHLKTSSLSSSFLKEVLQGKDEPPYSFLKIT
jgi:hypothetical protein